MITVTDNLAKRVAEERAKAGKPGLYLRLKVDSGGCSGFQYVFSWDEAPAPDDASYGEILLVDDVSLPFVKDATVDFVSTLMGSEFKVTNPDATFGCGCGQSFAV